MCADIHPTGARLRPCPQCGAMDRKTVLWREQWEIVECLRCAMVFLGSELDYSAQAENYDWLEEYAKEVARRKQKQPVMFFLSHLLRPLRPNTNKHMLTQTLRWKGEGSWWTLAAATGAFSSWRRRISM